MAFVPLTRWADAAHLSVVPLPTASPVPATAHHARPAPDFDQLIARTAARLRPVCRSMPPAAFDALVHELVLDATRFTLRWAEE